MIQIVRLGNGYMIELTAREFFCGALGMTTGLKLGNKVTLEEMSKVMEGVRQRYNISVEEAKDMVIKLDEEFEKDAQT